MAPLYTLRAEIKSTPWIPPLIEPQIDSRALGLFHLESLLSAVCFSRLLPLPAFPHDSGLRLCRPVTGSDPPVGAGSLQLQLAILLFFLCLPLLSDACHRSGCSMPVAAFSGG